MSCLLLSSMHIVEDPTGQYVTNGMASWEQLLTGVMHCTGLGLAVAAGDQPDMARPILQRALGLLQKTLGQQHPLTKQAASAVQSC